MTRAPRSAGTGTVHLALRQVLTDRVAVLTVAVVVAVCAGLGAAVPRWLDGLLTDGLRQSVAQASPAQRDLVTQVVAAPPSRPGPEPFEPTRRLLADARAALPPEVRRLTGEPLYSVAYRGFRGSSVTPRLQDPRGVLSWDVGVLSGVDEQVRYVDGRPPAGVTTTAVPGAEGSADGRDPVVGERTVAQVAVSVATARDTGVAVGSRVDLEGNLDLLVVGVFEPVSAGHHPYWGWNGEVLEPPIEVSPALGDIYHPVAVADEAAWPAIARQVGYSKQPTLLLRLPVHGAGLESSRAADLLTRVRQVESTRQPVGTPPDPGERSFGTQLENLQLGTRLDDELVTHLHARAAATAVVSLVVTGLLGACLAVLALATRLVVERRRSVLALAVARGASPRQVAALTTVEGLLLGLPPALAATVLVAATVPGEPGLWGTVLPVVLGVAPAVLLPVLARPGGLRAVRRDVAGPRARRWRLVGEGLVVALAVTALVLLRRRGLATDGFEVVGGRVTLGSGVEAPSTGVDPLLAATPPLVALALALLLVRLYPRPVAALAGFAARRPGAVPFLGAARAGRDAAAGTLPLVVLVLALSTSVFGVVVAATSDRGAEQAAWQALGAPARITSVGFRADAPVRAREVPGVRSAAALAVEDADVVTQRRDAVAVIAGVDAAAMDDVQRGVPGAVPFGALTQPRDGAVPVVASRGLAAIGEEVTLEVGRARVPALVVGTAQRVPGLLTARPFVVADRQLLAEGGASLPVAGALLLSLDPGADEATVEEELRTVLGTTAPLSTHEDAVHQVRAQPLVAGTLGAFPAVAATAAGLSGLAVVLTLVVGAPERTRLLSRLRTLGLSQRQARWLVVWEVAPMAGTALLAGAVTGVLVGWWLVPTIDLRAFTGGAVQPPPVVDVLGVLAVGAAFVLVTSAFLAVAVSANRRLRLGAVLRVGEGT